MDVRRQSGDCARCRAGAIYRRPLKLGHPGRWMMIRPGCARHFKFLRVLLAYGYMGVNSSGSADSMPLPRRCFHGAPAPPGPSGVGQLATPYVPRRAGCATHWRRRQRAASRTSSPGRIPRNRRYAAHRHAFRPFLGRVTRNFRCHRPAGGGTPPNQVVLQRQQRYIHQPTDPCDRD